MEDVRSSTAATLARQPFKGQRSIVYVCLVRIFMGLVFLRDDGKSVLYVSNRGNLINCQCICGFLGWGVGIGFILPI
jgi:hypothetical protein